MRRILPNASLTLALASLLFATAGCKKDGAATQNPEGKSQEQIDAERTAAIKAAEQRGLISLANEDLARGCFMSAMRRADEALAKNPNDADAYAVRGAALWRAGDVLGSTAAFEKSLEIQADNFGAIAGLGRNLQALGNHARAVELQDRLIAAESAGFQSVMCAEGNTCEVGYCDSATNMCKAEMQVAPRLVKLWSQYLLLDVDGALKTTDEIAFGVGGDAETLEFVRRYASVLAALKGKGPFNAIEGETGTSDVSLDNDLGVKFGSAVVAGEFGRVAFLETRTETLIHTEAVKTLKLTELAQVEDPASGEKMGLVLVPEVEIKGIKVKNVPALVTDLASFESGGDVPMLALGRQFLHNFGAITFDFRGGKATLSKAGGAPAGAAELPLVMLDTRGVVIPVVPVGIDGAEHRFWVWLGGTWKTGLTVVKKHYLKSGHRPLDIEDPDDADIGLKMVVLNQIQLGDKSIPGSGGVVLVNDPADPTLQMVTQATAFELGGYLNLAIAQHWKITYAFAAGKVYVE